MPTITPFLWFENQAEQAMQHYLSIFKHGKAINVSRNGSYVVSVTFELEGQRFIGLNAGSSGAQSVILMALVISLTMLQFKYAEKKVTYR